MEMMKKVMEIIVSSIALIILFFFLPPFYLYKCTDSILSSIFQENLAGKVVLITGASSGIGEVSLSYEYAKRGAILVLVARRVKSLEEVAKTCRDIGSPGVLVVPADVSKPNECQRFIDAAINQFGRLDHLVNNAGIESVRLIEEITDLASFRTLMDVNFWGSVYPTFYAIPYLKETKGRVVVMSSIAGYAVFPRISFYCASKGALISLYDTLRMEFDGEIAITIVAPGVIESEMTKGKLLTAEGKTEVNQDLRDAVIGLVPVEPVKDFAEKVTSRICSGARYIIEPGWWYQVYLYRVFIPEVVDWFQRFFYTLSPRVPVTSSLTKKMLDYLPVRGLFYMHSLRNSDIKRD